MPGERLLIKEYTVVPEFFSSKKFKNISFNELFFKEMHYQTHFDLCNLLTTFWAPSTYAPSSDTQVVIDLISNPKRLSTYI